MITKTDRCTLHTMSSQDIPQLVSLFTDPKTREFLGGSVELGDALARLAGYLDDPDRAAYTVRTRDEADVIGLISVGPFEQGPHCEISYQFYPNYWGFGYAAETVGAVVEQLLCDPTQQSIFAETQTANARSCRLLRQIGMHEHKYLMRHGESQTVFVRQRKGPE